MRWLILSVCAFWAAAGTATALQLPATDVEPPRYDGAVVKVYMTRLVAKIRDLAVEERIPADSLSEEVVLKACDEMEGAWSPARRGDGRAVNYTLRMKLWLPLGKIERAVNPDPLLFMGGDPYPAFYEWVRSRVGFNSLRFPGVNGRMRILFYIEPDGDITIGRVLQSPDKDLERKVIRVIQRSRGKWTPRKVNGVPQRTSYEFRCNYIGNAY